MTNAIQRIEFDATCEEPNPTFHDAGTWRGSDIAAAATIVNSSSRLAHMIRPLRKIVRLSGYRQDHGANASRGRSAASASAGNLRRTNPYLLLEPDELDEELEPAPPEAEPEALSPPDCFCVSLTCAAPVPPFSLQSFGRSALLG